MSIHLNTSADIIFLQTPEEYRNAIFNLVDSAQTELHAEFYIFNHDNFGKIFLEKLVRAAKRGVNVNLILDGFGSEPMIRENFTELRNLPFGVRIYHPLPWGQTRFSNLWKAIRDFLNQLGTMNRRNHRKMVMADGQKIILGSHNIWDESLEWREASLLLDNTEAASSVMAGFTRIWHKSVDLSGKKHRRRLIEKLRGMHAHKNESGALRILDNSSLRNSRASKQEVLNQLRRAQKRVWIVTPYFCPYRPIMKSLKTLARKDIDVRLLLPGRLDINMSRWLAQALYQELLDCGVRIFETNEDVVLHAKVSIIDDIFILGSSNLNRRSVLRDLEIDCLASDKPTFTAIDKWMQNLIADSIEISDIAQVELYGLKRLAAGLLSPLKNFR